MTATVVVTAIGGVLIGMAALSFKALNGTYSLANVVLDGASGFLWLVARAEPTGKVILASHLRTARNV
jgi:hypothetical protein